MIRLLHLIAIAVLLGSAGYAYSIKYETLYHAEELVKLKSRLQKERDAIAILKAEWQHLNRADRLQAAVERHLDLQPLTVQQLARFADLPARAAKTDEIARKLESLGLGPTATPQDRRANDARTPSTQTPAR